MPRATVEYSERPSILDTAPWHGHPSDFVIRFARSAQILLCQRLSFYPDARILFVGRDMEYYYDAARLILQNEPQQHLIALINVSRASLACPELENYCQQELLAFEQPIVIVDSGFNGNIIRALRQVCAESPLYGHLLFSCSPDFTSSRAAAAALVDSAGTWSRRRAIENFVEHLPHFTGKCVGYRMVRGTIEAVSLRSTLEARWRYKSVAFMRRLRGALTDTEVVEAWSARWRAWSRFLGLATFHVTQPVVVVLDGDVLFASTNTGARFAIPFGFSDFVEEASRRIQSRELEVRVVTRSGHLEAYLASKLVGDRPLWDSGILPANMASRGRGDLVLHYPSRACRMGSNHQGGLHALLDKADQLHVQRAISPEELRSAMIEVLQVDRGGEQMRDLLEEFPQRRLGIRLRDDVLQMTWDLITDVGPEDRDRNAFHTAPRATEARSS